MSEDNEIIDNKAVRRIRIKVRIRLTAVLCCQFGVLSSELTGKTYPPISLSADSPL